MLADPLSATDSKPVAGLRAFGRVYASRAYGPRFLSEGCHAALGFADIDALLCWWEADHLATDHHDLLLVLRMWAGADIAANPRFAGDRAAALAAIGAPALVMPCATNQYFLVHEAEAEAACMPQARFRVMQSEWGHCAGGPGREPAAMAQVGRDFGTCSRAERSLRRRMAATILQHCGNGEKCAGNNRGQ